MRYLLYFIIASLFSIKGKSQQTENTYLSVDNYVSTLGDLKDKNVASIADTLTQLFESKENKARAIFCWIANNIALDPKLTRSNDDKNTDPVIVIQARKTSPIGFATLFQEMASIANIRCLIVNGYIKNSTENINNIEDEPNHSWNVVQLGTSPNEWYYVDAAKASGNLDNKKNVFTKIFKPEYFFSNKYIFNQDHYPQNKSWLLGEGPKSLKEFYALPLIEKGAYQFGVVKTNPSTGYITTKINTAFKFNFQLNNNTISNVEVVFGEAAKETKPERINFLANGNELSFSYKFKKEDTFPFRIIVNGINFISYLIETSE